MISFKINNIPQNNKEVVCNPLPDTIAKDTLLNLGCHVDHEGFDLNEIEQLYYKYNNVHLYHDKTWYKDGGQEKGTNGVLYDWFEQIDPIEKLIVDHSHFVFRYPIVGEAANQIKEYAKTRVELLRLLSTNFKCGLDLCIDYINGTIVEPIVHIEWDFDNHEDLAVNVFYIQSILKDVDWNQTVKTITQYNKQAKKNKITAFEQADFRSMLIFGKKSYYLIPTL